jgi:hypothetical protein
MKMPSVWSATRFFFLFFSARIFGFFFPRVHSVKGYYKEYWRSGVFIENEGAKCLVCNKVFFWFFFPLVYFCGVVFFWARIFPKFILPALCSQMMIPVDLVLFFFPGNFHFLFDSESTYLFPLDQRKRNFHCGPE